MRCLPSRCGKLWIQELFDLIDSGVPNKEIARRAGVAPGTLTTIRSRCGFAATLSEVKLYAPCN